MRELKFRAWNPKSREWKNPGNVYVNGHGEKIWALGFKYDIYPTIELSQYTGLKDKNGVEIYEGDLVNIDNSHWDSSEVFITELGTIATSKDDGFCSDWLIDDWDKCEVIGNIYENKELLPKWGIAEIINKIYENKELLDE